MDQVVAALEQVVPTMEETGVELHLETSLSPSEFSRLLARLPSPLIKVNYDSGNSASLGYDPTEEFAAYGARLGSIHIKDRVLGGGTVPLGRETPTSAPSSRPWPALAMPATSSCKWPGQDRR